MGRRRGLLHSLVQPSSGKGTFIGEVPPSSFLTPAPTLPAVSPTAGGMVPHQGRGWERGGPVGGPNGTGAHLPTNGLPYSPSQLDRVPPSGPRISPPPGAAERGDVTASALGDPSSDWYVGHLANGTTQDLFDPFFCDFLNGTCANDSFFKFSNDSLDGYGDDIGDESNIQYWKLVLIIFPFFTVFGNVLVVLSVVREKSLKTVTNYFICSLAVADIMVAVVVMPFALYTETMTKWYLGIQLCDFYVACDVMACTASILNLTAISVDRFIAVTQPIKYAKHKNSKRVYIMIALTWIISAAIAMPIMLGANVNTNAAYEGQDENNNTVYVTRRDNDTDCGFYNSDFLIYSSMGSFYIPSVIMILLYWKIYRVIHQRAQKSLAAKRKAVDRKTLQSVIENTGVTGGGSGNSAGGNGVVVNSAPPGAGTPGGEVGEEAETGASGEGDGTDGFPPPPSPLTLLPPPTVKTGLAKMDNGRVVTTYNTTVQHQHPHLAPPPCPDDPSVSNMPSASDSHDGDEDDEDDDDSNANVRSQPSSDHATQLLQLKHHHPHHPPLLQQASRDGDLGAQLIANPGAVAAERREASGRGSGGSQQAETPFTSPGNSGRKKEGNRKNSATGGGSGSGSARLKKGMTKFNFHMRTSRKRKEKSSSRRERKATKTLAIVLGGFLACWIPFFTMNIILAFCIRYKAQAAVCTPHAVLMSLFQWLGYINSFLNPVVYTIFNPEFRKAFKKIILEPCAGNGRR